MNKFAFLIMGILMFLMPVSVQAFDHKHSSWDILLAKHVKWISKGTASQVDYSGLKKDHAKLKLYLNSLSGISKKEFESWTKEQQLSFLINAYNAFTIELILTKYPYLKSIKDTGSFLKNPWKKKFFNLLGELRNLDWIEHDMIRKPGVYDDPRIHAAVNCASIGCPALRDRAFKADSLDADLEDSMQRFLNDHSRNRYNSKTRKLEVSKIFDWYGGDFKKGWLGFDSLENFFAKYAALLAEEPVDQAKIKVKMAAVEFLDYDWNLNDVN